MTTYTIEKLPDEPIVILKAHKDYDVTRDVEETAKAVNQVLDDLNEPVTFIQDLTLMTVDFEDVVVGADTTGRGENATFHHQNIREIIAITHDPVMRQVFEGMKSSTYGHVQMHFADTLAEALTLARKF